MRLGGEFANRSATHGAEPWIPGDQLYAAESEQGSSDNGGSRVLFGADETPGHLSQRQQRLVIETGIDSVITS